MAVPRLVKVVVSMGVGGGPWTRSGWSWPAKDLAIIAGQKPLVCKARKSVSNFKVRAGSDTGLKVTLRGAADVRVPGSADQHRRSRVFATSAA